MSATLPRLIVITDTTRAPAREWLRRLDALLGLAVPSSVMVQLRDPALPIRERQHFGRSLRELCTDRGQLLAVNDRLDLALLLEADAVHLPGSGVEPEDARRFARSHGRGWPVLTACHDPEELRTTAADAVLLSPVLAPRKGRPALGMAGVELALRARAERSPAHPCGLYALGGVTHRGARELVAAGADGVALIGEFLSEESPRELLASLRIASG